MPPAATKAAGSGGKAVASVVGKKTDKDIKGPKPKAFRVQVHVIEVKDIRVPHSQQSHEQEVLPDLVVTASVGRFGTKYTQVVRQSTACTFDCMLEWKFMMTFEEMQTATVQLNVLNANTDAKSEPLGMYALPLS